MCVPVPNQCNVPVHYELDTKIHCSQLEVPVFRQRATAEKFKLQSTFQYGTAVHSKLTKCIK